MAMRLDHVSALIRARIERDSDPDAVTGMILSLMMLKFVILFKSFNRLLEFESPIVPEYAS
jgi:hypothetical protein